MELINQHTKQIMEECKLRARDAGLSFDDESLEYIVTNRDMLELSPKVMIPTLYDYWVNDVELLKGIGKYKLYPHNPYETVINSRPAISFYNDNNPDWLNIMIFYHVIGHIDFFQNNNLFQHTWNDDFVGQALADKRLLAQLRSEHGRWVDYVIEFARSIDNLVGYFDHLNKLNYSGHLDADSRVSYYFDKFLQEEEKAPDHEIFSEIERYNSLYNTRPELVEQIFFAEVKQKYPEFEAKYDKFLKEDESVDLDIMEFILENSPFLNQEKNEWMKLIVSIIRNTSMYFSPQMRSKIINEGWASYWHDYLFRKDERIQGHEMEYARTNSAVTSLSRVGLNPYAIGLRLIEYVEDLANKGKLSWHFQQINNIESRDDFDRGDDNGKESIFKLRSHFSDFMLVNTFVDQDFVDQHDLFVVGQRQNQQRGTIEYYIKSKKAKDYKKMILDSLVHPPVIKIDLEKTDDDRLYLRHIFEGKQLYKNYIGDTMMGIEFLWGGKVQLETTEILVTKGKDGKREHSLRKVLYHMKDKKLSKSVLG